MRVPVCVCVCMCTYAMENSNTAVQLQGMYVYGTNYKKIDASVRSSVRFSPVVYVWAPDETPVSSSRAFTFH